MVSLLCGCTKPRKSSLNEDFVIDADYSDVQILPENSQSEDIELDTDYSEVFVSAKTSSDNNIEIDADYSEVYVSGRNSPNDGFVIDDDYCEVHISALQDDDEPSYCEVPSEYSDNEPVYFEGAATEEGHSSPVYDQVPERDEYIDNKTMMLAKVDSQQRVISHLKDENNQLQLRINNLEQRNNFLEAQNRELMARLQGLQAQNKTYDYDLPHSSGGSASSMNDVMPPQQPPLRNSAAPRAGINNRPSYSAGNSNDYSNLPRDDQKKRHQTLPPMDMVSEKTQHITSAVTLLRDAIRNDNLHQLPEVYQRILAASQGVASVFPENPQWQTIKLSLELLKRSATELSQLSLAGCNGDRKLFIDSHVNLAKDIARATKSLVGYVQNAMSAK